ncbi:hypothetical protein AMTRI_Chr04g184710 [Amborella trichopoda]
MGCIARPVIPFTRTPANGCHTPSIIIQPPTLISTTLITKFESQSQQEESNSSSNNKDGGRKWKEGVRMRKVETTDWVATSLTRRFGLGAGLAWFGFLAFSVVSEQIKTRLEVSQEQAGELYQVHLYYSSTQYKGGISPLISSLCLGSRSEFAKPAYLTANRLVRSVSVTGFDFGRFW